MPLLFLFSNKCSASIVKQFPHSVIFFLSCISFPLYHVGNVSCMIWIKYDFVSYKLNYLYTLDQTNFYFKIIAIIDNCICITLGRRLDVPVLRTLYAPYGPTCVLHCLNHNCCRSVNYNKKCSSSECKDNCELLHYVASEQREQMKHDENFDHLVLLQPNRVSYIILYRAY